MRISDGASMGNMKEKKEKGNIPWELGLLFLTRLELGNTRSLIGNIISLEDDPALLAKEQVCS